jgi:hypothetical protein
MNELERLIDAAECLVAACMLNDSTPRETIKLACLLDDAIGVEK